MFHYLVPDWYLPSVYKISIENLKEKQVKFIITDMDNTILGWDVEEATQELIDWNNQLKQEGISLMILSNNKNENKVKKISNTLGIPYLAHAKKPSKDGFLKAMKILKAKPEETMVIGDQIATDILGGNRVDCFTVFVDPISDKAATITKIYRKFESVFLYILKKLKLIIKKC